MTLAKRPKLAQEVQIRNFAGTPMDFEKYSGLLYVARVFSSSAPVRAARPSFSEPITGDERFQVGDLRFAHAANEFFGGQDDAQDIFALVRIAERAACEAGIDRTRDEGD